MGLWVLSRRVGAASSPFCTAPLGGCLPAAEHFAGLLHQTGGTASEHLNHIWGCSDSFSASAAVSCPHLAMYDDFWCSLAMFSLNPGSPTGHIPRGFCWELLVSTQYLLPSCWPGPSWALRAWGSGVLVLCHLRAAPYGCQLHSLQLGSHRWGDVSRALSSCRDPLRSSQLCSAAVPAQGPRAGLSLAQAVPTEPQGRGHGTQYSLLGLPPPMSGRWIK